MPILHQWEFKAVEDLLIYKRPVDVYVTWEVKVPLLWGKSISRVSLLHLKDSITIPILVMTISVY